MGGAAPPEHYNASMYSTATAVEPARAIPIFADTPNAAATAEPSRVPTPPARGWDALDLSGVSELGSHDGRSMDELLGDQVPGMEMRELIAAFLTTAPQESSLLGLPQLAAAAAPSMPAGSTSPLRPPLGTIQSAVGRDGLTRSDAPAKLTTATPTGLGPARRAKL